MTSRPILVSVAWPYVNGDLHVGHLAGYLLPADFFARYQRLRGNPVLMVSGSDCYGTPITVEADKRGLKPQDIVDEYHARDLELFEVVGISYDLYTQTTTANHQAVVQDVFLKCLAEGYIFKDTTDQYYDPVNHKFLPDRYVEGTCPVCGDTQARSDQCDVCGSVLEQGQLIDPKSKLSSVTVELKPTEHYFFDWTKAEPFLSQYLDKAEGWKDWVLTEARSWLKQGLKARAITRDLDWGVEIPTDRIPAEQQLEGAENKRIYVWFEAVLGYLSASKEWASEVAGDAEAWQQFWISETARHYYFMGKDNLIFHTLFLPTLLHVYDERLRTPDVPSINQFLTLEGKKFSKSKGVIVDSRYICEQYGTDSVRFYLALIMPEFSDANFSWYDFVHKHNDVLIGKVGNYINRVLTLAQGVDFSASKPDTDLHQQVATILDAAETEIETCLFKAYAEHIVELAELGNKYLSETTPWLIRRDDPTQFAAIIANALYLLQVLTVLLTPLMPSTAQRVWTMLRTVAGVWDDHLLTHTWKATQQATIEQKPQPLFTPIDESVIELETAKLAL